MRSLLLVLALCWSGCSDSTTSGPVDGGAEARVGDAAREAASGDGAADLPMELGGDGAADDGAVDDGGGVDGDAAGADATAGAITLFNGTDLSGIKLQSIDASQITIQGGELRCAAGKHGYWYTEQSYENYTLRFDFRFVRPANLVNDADFNGNSGYLIHIQTPHKVWPTCVEVQGLYRDIANIFPLGAPAVPVTLDNVARDAARRPIGQWNSMQIISDGGKLTSWLNGKQIAKSDAYSLTKGPIGFQCEGVEIHWRDVVLTPAP